MAEKANHPGGRPSKYTPELLQKAYAYLDKWETLGDAIPSHQALAGYLEISKSTMYVWAKEEDKSEFSYILERIMNNQGLILINKGLSGEFNSNITKLVLGKHGYHSKQETELSGNLGITKIERVIVHPEGT